MTRPLLLDLFCGAGGAAAGYVAAGFDVIGVDIAPMPRYPWEFIQADAIDVLDELELSDCWPLPPGQRQRRRCIDVGELTGIHASPPCQRWSTLSDCVPGTKDKYPQLIEPSRARLQALGLPWVIENVQGAPLRDPLKLCGTMFGRRMMRHRLFETSFTVCQPRCQHDPRRVTIHTYNANTRARLREEFGQDVNLSALFRAEMRVEWMNGAEASESIPPVYTQYIGAYLRAAADSRAILAEAA